MKKTLETSSGVRIEYDEEIFKWSWLLMETVRVVSMNIDFVWAADVNAAELL